MSITIAQAKALIAGGTSAETVKALGVVDDAGNQVDIETVKPKQNTEDIAKTVSDAVEKAMAELPARVAKAIPAPEGRVEGGNYRHDDVKSGGYKSLGEFMGHVAKANTGAPTDKIKAWEKAAATTYANESVGADGGYLVPPTILTSVMQVVAGEESLLGRCTQIPLTGNSVTFPVDETTPWGSTGIRQSIKREGQAGTATKPVLQTRTLRLKKRMTLVPVSDELLSDASASEAYVTQKAATDLAFAVNNSILNGTGGEEALGILNSGCLVSFTRTTSSTVKVEDIAGVMARLLPSSMGNAVWLIHQSVLAKLVQLTLGNYPIFLPGGNVAGAPFGTLLGRPIIVTQYNVVLGTVGDVILADLKGYMAATKALESASSMHLYFDANQTAFRFTYRMDGMPWLSSAVSPRSGSDTLSHFVAIAS